MSDQPRPEVPPALQKLAAWSWRLLVVLGAAGLVLYLLILLKVIVVPVIVALFLATLLVPLVRWLEARGWKHLTAVLAVFVGVVLLLAGIIAGFIPLIGNELGTLRQRADEGVGEVQRFIASRPFGISEDDLNRYLDQARQRLAENSTGLTQGAGEERADQRQERGHEGQEGQRDDQGDADDGQPDPDEDGVDQPDGGLAAQVAADRGGGAAADLAQVAGS